MPTTQPRGGQILDGTIDLVADTIGTLPASKGGTGNATNALNNVLLGNGTGALQAVAGIASGHVLTWNGTTWVSQVAAGGGGPVTKQDFTDQVTAPTTPAAGTTSLFSMSRAGRGILKWKNSAGEDYAIQATLASQVMQIWTPNAVTAGDWWGNNGGAGAGTYAFPAPASTNFLASIIGGTYANVVTTVNQVLGINQTTNTVWRGNATGLGGFNFFCRFGLSTWTAGSRLFVGLATANTVISANPSASLNIAGFGIDAGDTAITFMTNDGTGVAVKTAIAGQPALATNNAYDVYMYAPPFGGSIGYRIENAATQALIAEGTITVDLPLNTVFMGLRVMASNAAVATVAAINLKVAKVYCETDV